MKTLIMKRKYLVSILATVFIILGTQGSYGQTITASTPHPLTETNLHGSVVTLTLSGGIYGRQHIIFIERSVNVVGIPGVTIKPFGMERVSDTQLTVQLEFSGNIDTDAALTFTVGAGAIEDYDGNALTATLPVTAVEESLTASTELDLTEATLHGSVVTLTLSGRRFTDREWDIKNALTLSGIEGVTVASSLWLDVERVSDTEVTLPLTFSGNIDTNTTLTIEVGANAIIGYNKAFTIQLSVSAVEESLVSSTEAPLTEAGGVVRLTLNGRRFAFAGNSAITFSDIEGVTIESHVYNVSLDERYISATEIDVDLIFVGNFDNDTTFTITIAADGIANYNKDLSVQLPVTAVEESLVASTRFPLTEAISFENVITLTLSGRRFADDKDIVANALTFSGIEGVTVERLLGLDRVSDTEVRLRPAFGGDFNTDTTLTLTVGADAINYNKDFTFKFPVTAVEESLTASTEFALTEANLNESVITLSLSGRWFDDDIESYLTVSGIEGVTVSYVRLTGSVKGLSDTAEAAAFWGLSLKEAWRIAAFWGMGLTEAAIGLAFEGNFDTDATLTLTVGTDAIILGYTKENFTFEFPVTAIGQSDATISISPSPIALPAIGEKLTLNLDIADGENVAGYQATLSFDPSVLRYVESANGNYLPADAFFVDPIFSRNSLLIAGNTLAGARNGDGTLATLTFEVYEHKPAMVTLSEVYLVDADGRQWDVTTENGEVIEPQELPQKIFGDINTDGVVNIADLVIVSNRFGLRGQSRADVNGDHLVDIVDLVLVANALGADAAAPSLNPQTLELLTAADVKEWLNQAQKITPTDPDYRRGISMLEQLHKALTPKETALLPNFPNPFNPETWIPYHLAKDADVTLHIYAMNSRLVRTLMLGHQPAGMYQNRSRAVYWDGKNQFGEPVASGVYFYTLTAGDFTATRKMLIRK